MDVVKTAIAQSLGIDEEDLEDLEYRYFEEITEMVDPDLAMRAELLGMSESDALYPEPVPEVDDETFHTTLNQYNALARYEPVITETMEQARNVALIWWNLVLRLPGEIPEPGSPREMARELRKKLGLRRAGVEGLPEWKHAGCLALRETRREPREGAGGHCHWLPCSCTSQPEGHLQLTDRRHP